MSDDQKRLDIIKEIESKRKSKLIVYFTGDRQNAVGMINEDAVEPLYNNLINLEFDESLKKKTIDLFLYSRGGNVSVPWKIATMIREFCDEFNVLIPYKAYSATTLLALGADCIIMGKKGELGPIDPTLEREEGQISKRIPVEDVNSYISFIKEKANINDQAALATMIKSLVDEITPLVVGNVNRQNSHIRLVARKLLTSRNEKVDEEKIDSIIETLTEKMYYHGHGIGRKEAKEIGLPINNPKSEIEDLMWDLYIEYRNSLELDNPIFPDVALGEEESKIIPQIPVAIIESREKSYEHKIDLEFTKQRKIPSSPQINVNVNLQLPPEIPPDQIPSELQQILQDLMSQVAEQSKVQVQQEIIRQSPLTGFNGRARTFKWYEER